MRAFLTAEWRTLAMLNFEVEPTLLAALVPRDTELDTFGGRVFLSVVGFIFANTCVLGAPVPGHRTFEEVNLRFYVRRSVGSDVRRGVTFIREIVPKPLIAAVARWAYNEPYLSAPMRHSFAGIDATGAPLSVRYEWKVGGGWAGLQAEAEGAGTIPPSGSEAEFITEHYWGYTRQRDGSTVEYRVEHPRWHVWPATSASLIGDVSAVYGAGIGHVLAQRPASAFIANGSPVRVGWPRRLES